MAPKLDKLQCPWCLTPFSPTRHWQRFCSVTCRAKAWADPALKPVAHQCYYCGDVADTIDHVPPQVSRPNLMMLGLWKRYPFVEVQCCRECNTLLGCRPLWTLTERKKFIKKALRKRYSRYLSIPDWTPEDVSDLGYTLQRLIVHGLSVRDWVQSRLTH